MTATPWYTPKYVVMVDEGDMVTFQTTDGTWIGNIGWGNSIEQPDEHERMDKALNIAWWLDAAFEAMVPKPEESLAPPSDPGMVAGDALREG